MASLGTAAARWDPISCSVVLSTLTAAPPPWRYHRRRHRRAKHCALAAESNLVPHQWPPVLLGLKIYYSAKVLRIYISCSDLTKKKSFDKFKSEQYKNQKEELVCEIIISVFKSACLIWPRIKNINFKGEKTQIQTI